MNVNDLKAQEYIRYAREALRSGNRGAARRWAEQAAQLAPQMEDPWLILAAVASPRASMAFIEQALQIHPDSPRAHQAMQWALKRLQETPPPQAVAETPQQAPAPAPGAVRVPPRSAPLKKTRRLPVFPFLLLLLGCLVVLFAAWTASTSPALAFILGDPSASNEQEHPQVWAQVEIAKPTYTSQPSQAFAQIDPTEALPTPTEFFPAQDPTLEPALALTPTPTQVVVPAPVLEVTSTPAPEVIMTPGALAMEIVDDTPTPVAPPTRESTEPTLKPQEQSKPVAGNGARWIDINLSEQRLYAYEGDVAINAFVVSTGTWATPTVTGTFKIWNKTRIQDMSGPGYYLPNVPYVMYFYKDYGMHGTYWHNNFGTPMSHGCVNLTIPDAEWLYSWAYEGMTVKVHY